MGLLKGKLNKITLPIYTHTLFTLLIYTHTLFTLPIYTHTLFVSFIFTRDNDMLVVNSSCQVSTAEAFCLDSPNSCFYTVKSTECEPNGQAVYIKCGM